MTASQDKGAARILVIEDDEEMRSLHKELLGEKISRVASFWKTIKPGEVFDVSIDATTPRAAVKEKALGKIEIDMVYVPSPLKWETSTVSGRVE